MAGPTPRYAAGGGFVLAAKCDLRFAAESASFTTIFSKRGLIAEHGMTWLLPARSVPPTRSTCCGRHGGWAAVQRPDSAEGVAAYLERRPPRFAPVPVEQTPVGQGEVER